MGNLKVYYGYSKLTAKAITKRELAVYFENAESWKNDSWVAKRMHIVYTRTQTDEEAKDGSTSNRNFTKWSLFIDDKAYKGDIDKVLQVNYDADINNVSIEELETIREALKKAFHRFYENKYYQL